MSNPATPPSAHQPRVLILADYFPKPGNELMGNWAMEQAQAMACAGWEICVASPTAWVPAFAARSPRLKVWADAPISHKWGPIVVHYPRWLYHPIGPIKKRYYDRPSLLMGVAWHSIRRSLIRIAGDFRPDLIFAHHTAVSGYLARRLSKHFGVPYVVTDHTFEDVSDCHVRLARRKFMVPIYRDALMAISVSKRMKCDVDSIFPGTRSVAVGNGSRGISPDVAATPRPPELVGKFVVFSAAHLYERKGIPVLIDAFAEFARTRPDAVLRIAGDGDCRPEAERAIARSGIVSQITLLGSQPHDRVLREMAWCDVFALIGWDEPWGVVYNEAISAGKPVVFSNDGGINDVLTNLVHGIAVPPRDVTAAAEALRTLADDADLRYRLGQAGRALFEAELTWDANVRTLRRLLTAGGFAPVQQSGG
jgi:glycosyltransferase involved in cell wall biosynthesis